jgi:hypothetical protein
MKRNTLYGIIALVVAITLVVGVVVMRPRKSSDRQAIFLTNGQVYFGYADNEKADPVILTDVYYLQQVSNTSLQSDTTKDTQTPKINLVKLGSELHGPRDVLRINRDQILFIEDIKPDSKVSQAINEYIETHK